MAKYVDNFRKWALEQADDFMINSPMDVKVYTYPNARYSFLNNIKTGKSVRTKLNSNDNYDPMVATGVLWAKYKGIEIPKQKRTVPVRSLKYGQRFSFINSGHNFSEYVFIAIHPLTEAIVYSNLDGHVYKEKYNQSVYIAE